MKKSESDVTSSGMKTGDPVRVVRGMHGGREGVVTSSFVGLMGQPVVQVRLEVPKLIAQPEGPTEIVVLPYAPVELEQLQAVS